MGESVLDLPEYATLLTSFGAQEIISLLKEGDSVAFGTIAGTVYINETDQTLTLPDINGATISKVPPGKKLLQLDFKPNKRVWEPADEAQARQNLRAGIEALPLLCAFLRGDRGLDITMITGTTNLRMAQFAVRHLGFTAVMPIDLAKEKDVTTMLVFATKESILAAVDKLPTELRL